MMTDIKAVSQDVAWLFAFMHKRIEVSVNLSSLFFSTLVDIHIQCSHSSESINRSSISVEYWMCVCVWWAHCWRWHTLFAAVSILNLQRLTTHFTTTDKIFFFMICDGATPSHCHRHPHPHSSPSYVLCHSCTLNAVPLCIGIDSVLRQLNIQLSQTVYGFAFAKRLQSASRFKCVTVRVCHFYSLFKHCTSNFSCASRIEATVTKHIVCLCNESDSVRGEKCWTWGYCCIPTNGWWKLLLLLHFFFTGCILNALPFACYFVAVLKLCIFWSGNLITRQNFQQVFALVSSNSINFTIPFQYTLCDEWWN